MLMVGVSPATIYEVGRRKLVMSPQLIYLLDGSLRRISLSVFPPKTLMRVKIQRALERHSF